MRIKNLTKSIEEELRKLNLNTDLILQSRLNKNAINEQLSKTGLHIPNEVIELYNTINGAPNRPGTILNEMHFFPGFYLMSLEEAVDSYLRFRLDERWNSKWFPLFANGGGDFYVIECNDENIEHGPIKGFILGGPEAEIEYANLENMLLVILECYKSGAFFLDGDNYLDIDYVKRKQVAKKYNPDLHRWL